MSLFILFLYLGTLSSDQVQLLSFHVHSLDGQVQIDVKRVFEIRSHRGVNRSTLVIPVSPRVKMKNFTAKLEVHGVTDPAGKAHLYKKNAYTSRESTQHEYWTAVFPGAIPGSTISSQYTLVADDAHFTRPLRIDRTFPIQHCRIVIECVHGMEPKIAWLNKSLSSRFTLDKRESAKSVQWVWNCENLEPLEDDHLFPSVMFYSLDRTNGWEDLVQFASALFPSDKLSERACPQSLLKLETKEEFLRKAYELVRDSIRYESISLGTHDYVPEPPENVLKNNYGDCKDKTGLLLALLRRRDIDAFPILVSAANPWPEDFTFPSLSLFNHVIVGVNQGGEIQFLDPTARFAKFGELPLMDQKAPALFLRPGQASLYRLPQSQECGIQVESHITTLGKNRIRWLTTMVFSGSSRSMLAEFWKNTNESVRKKRMQFLRYFLDPRLNPFLEHADLKLNVLENKSICVLINIEEQLASSSGGERFLPSSLLRWPVLWMNEQGCGIDFPFSMKESVNLQCGRSELSLPGEIQNFMMDQPDVHFSFQCSYDSSGFILTRELTSSASFSQSISRDEMRKINYLNRFYVGLSTQCKGISQEEGKEE